MVLLGFEPMTFEWDAWQKGLRGKQVTTRPTRLNVLVG